MANTDSERRLVLVWPLSLTGMMDLQVDGKDRPGKKIGSGFFGGHLQCSYPLTTDQHLAWNIWLGYLLWN
jgi:hypothetical protein